MNQILICLLTLLFSLSGPAMGGYSDFWQSSLAARGGDVKYHYTNAPEDGFKNGMWSHSSVTDTPNLTPQQAVEQLGVKSPPDKVIPVRDGGNFVPNKPPIVDKHPLGPGGGKDFTNPNKVSARDVLPAIPIRGR